MSGAVITGTKTTLGLDVPGSTYDRVKVYPAGPTSGPEEVIVDLGTDRKVAPHDGGGFTFQRGAALALTRDEGLNLIRAVQRALGIDPDALVAAIERVEQASNDEPFPPTAESEEELLEAFDALYEASALSVGLKPASARAVQS